MNMIWEMSFTTVEVVAWWGAIVATLVLAWDIYKWKNAGARLRMTVAPNSILVGGGVTDKTVYVSVEVTNIGDLSTSVTCLGLHFYKDWMGKFLSNTEINAVILNNPTRQNLPVSLAPGEQWQAFIVQSEIEEMAKSGYLIIRISHSMKMTPAKKRLKIK